jgi:hypothetical protein
VYGRPVANIRHYESWILRSEDDGANWEFQTIATWSAAVETPLQGHPAHLLRLRNGQLICTYGFRDQPIGIRAALSRDNGRTWLEEDIVVIRQKTDNAAHNGYPLTVELADATLVSVYYLTLGGVTGIESTRWHNPWR